MLHQSLLVWNEYKQKNTIDSAHHQKVGKQWKHDTTCFNLYLFLSYIAKKNYPCLTLESVFFFFVFFFLFFFFCFKFYKQKSTFLILLFFFFFFFQFYQQKATFLLFHFVRVKTLWLSPIAFITKSQNTITNITVEICFQLYSVCQLVSENSVQIGPVYISSSHSKPELYCFQYEH